jgi:hypothetical protein
MLTERLRCPTVSLCLFATEGGAIYTTTSPTGDASGWISGVVSPGGTISELTCPTRERCLAVDGDGNVLFSDDPAGGASTWGKTHVVDGLNTLACPSNDFCMASRREEGRDDDEVYVSTTPTRGDTWVLVDNPGLLNIGVSCVSKDLCLAVGGRRDPELGYATVLAVTTEPLRAPGSRAWTLSEPDHFDSLDFMDDVSCFAFGMCLFTGFGTLAVSTDPVHGVSTWVQGPELGEDLTEDDPTCPTAQLCIVRTAEHRILASQQPAGGHGAWIDLSVGVAHNSFSAVSCAPGICAAVDTTGHVATTTNPEAGGWRSTSIAKGRYLVAVDCVSSKFCVAMDIQGNVYSSTTPARGGPWRTTDPGTGNRMEAIACGGPKMCVGITYDGEFYTTENPAGRWTKRVTKKNFHPAQIECPSSISCVATGWDFEKGAMLVSSRSPLTKAWSAFFAPVDLEGEMSLSCPQPSFCMWSLVGTGVTHVLTSNKPTAGKGAWQVNATSETLFEISCVSSRSCYAKASGIKGGESGQGMIHTSSPRIGTVWSRAELPPEVTWAEYFSCAPTNVCVGIMGDLVLTGVGSFVVPADRSMAGHLG